MQIREYKSMLACCKHSEDVKDGKKKLKDVMGNSELLKVMIDTLKEKGVEM